MERCDGVVQETEQQITNSPVASSRLPPATNLISWLPSALTPGNRNRQTCEDRADYTCEGDRHYTPLGASVTGGSVNSLKPEKKLAVISFAHRRLFDPLHCPHDRRIQENHHEALGGDRHEVRTNDEGKDARHSL